MELEETKGEGELAESKESLDNESQEPQGGVSPVFLGLVFFGLLVVAVLAMLLITAGDTKETPAPATLDGIAQEGKQIYLTSGNCNNCHPAEGRKGGLGPRLSTIGLSDDSIRKIIRNGKGSMPANTAISDDDITKIMVYLKAIKAAAG
jgi:mono/diheme cytochrome c family protein